MNEHEDPRRLLEEITYLASLASEPERVDKTLDRLRVITATTSQLTPDSVNSLLTIRSELKKYLIYDERLRSFTEESLQAQLDRHFNDSNSVPDVRRVALMHIGVAIVVAVALTAIPALAGLLHGQVVLAFFVFALFACLAFLFQSIKKDLVAQLHGSVNYLMGATVGTGLFALNFPVIAADSHLEHMPLMQHGGFLIGAVPVYACYYIAFYLYAKQLGVAVPLVFRPVAAVVGAVAVALIAAIVPHPVAVPDESFFDLAVVGFGVSVYFSAIAAVLSFMAVPRTTKIYASTALFLAISMALQTLGNGFFLVHVTFPSGDFSVNDQKGQVLTALLVLIALAFQYVAVYKTKVSLR